MTTYVVVVEVVPGDRSTRNSFVIDADSVDDAWYKARADWRRWGLSSRVIEVRETAAILRPKWRR